MMDPLADLVADGGFRAGLVCGLVAGVGLAAGSPFGRWVRGLSGLAVTGAAVIGLAVRSELPAGLVAGLVVLATTGWLTAGRRAPTRAVASLPGALMVARSVDLDGGPGWVRPAVVLIVAAGGALVAGFDRVSGERRAGSAVAPSAGFEDGELDPPEKGSAAGRMARRVGLSPVLLVVSAAGAYATTPETEHVVVLLGAALPVAVLAWWRPPLTLGRVGSLLVVALMAWVVAVDGAARPGAVVGGLACLGLLVILPALPAAPRAAPWPPGLVAVLHAGLVVVCSRVAGLRTSAADALAISALAWALATIALITSTRRGVRPTGRPG